MPIYRIFFIHRGKDVEKIIADRILEANGPNLIIDQENSFPPDFENEKIKIKYTDIKVYPVEPGKEIPVSKEKIHTFDIASHVGNSKTGDIDIFVFEKLD